jgi:hypothetical protein
LAIVRSPRGGSFGPQRGGLQGGPNRTPGPRLPSRIIRAAQDIPPDNISATEYSARWDGRYGADLVVLATAVTDIGALTKERCRAEKVVVHSADAASVSSNVGGSDVASMALVDAGCLSGGLGGAETVSVTTTVTDAAAVPSGRLGASMVVLSMQDAGAVSTAAQGGDSPWLGIDDRASLPWGRSGADVTALAPSGTVEFGALYRGLLGAATVQLVQVIIPYPCICSTRTSPRLATTTSTNATMRTATSTSASLEIASQTAPSVGASSSPSPTLEVVSCPIP